MKRQLLAILMMSAAMAVPAQADITGVAEDAPIPADTGIKLAPGFRATVFADGIGAARHMAVSDNGWVYVALMKPEEGFGAVALYDSDGDGKADERVPFARGMSGTGMGINDGHLYFAEDERIMRWPLPEGGAPEGEAEMIVEGFPNKRQHSAKPFTFDSDGHLYVNIGAPSNACMEKMRTKGSPGMDPCPILEEFGGVWRFDADKAGQTQVDGMRYATGIRNAMAIDWNPHAGALYIAQHGRDQLNSFFPDMYTEQQSAELPAEEFHRVEEGADIGWPYGYVDPDIEGRVLMPEYGGDGKATTDRGQEPLIAFPGHWAPNDLLFPRSEVLPAEMRTGAFIAFHGSWNRAPKPQAGYRVVFVPMDEAGAVSGDWVTFADGFAGEGPIMSPRNAKHRPTGLAEGADGAIYISSLMSGGRVWKVVYEGQ
ncbi:PQQ-dependent sugar dehydrogenase [Kordiimonas aestuarii]|uniref:PQQ-dependent sugar dehydrogenase n=1 Tax=Kordiimonas aestuarii TaxID=1005925 RepID=UPI0021D3065C|nr:PQQ-dependent sugar dehydrogenase [Kordiimonas aestuarii]